METLERNGDVVTHGPTRIAPPGLAEFEAAHFRTLLHEPNIGYPIISDDWIIQAEYLVLRRDGMSHNLAEMVALASPPGTSGTDRAFLEGHCNGSQFQGPGSVRYGDYVRQVAESHGQSTTGKVYLSQLADFPGDPRAWVSGRGDVEQVCREKGYGIKDTKLKAREPENPPTPGPAVAPDIVESVVRKEVAKVPKKDRRDIKLPDLREKVTNRLKPHWAKS